MLVFVLAIVAVVGAGLVSGGTLSPRTLGGGGGYLVAGGVLGLAIGRTRRTDRWALVVVALAIGLVASAWIAG